MITKKNNLTWLSKVLEFPPVNIHGVAQHSCASNANGILKKVLNVYCENISAVYVLDIETEKPPPIYDRDINNKPEELDRLHAAMK